MKKNIIAVLLCSILLSSCDVISNNSSDDLISNESSNDDLKTNKALNKPEIKYNETHKNINKEEYNIFLDNVKKFSTSLTSETINYFDVDYNFTMSPLSIYMALAVCSETTNNNTRQELLDCLGMDYEMLSTYTKVLFDKSTKLHYEEDYYTKEQIKTLHQELTNSIWIDNDVMLLDNALNKLADDYYCYAHHVDFQKDNDNTNKLVSEFIKEKTYGLIDNEYKFDDSTAMLIMNTLYMKFNWLLSGNELDSTKDKYDFKNTNNTITNTSLLKGSYSYGKKHIEEEYTSFYNSSVNGYKLHFIVPNDNYTLKDVYTSENLYEVLTHSYRDYHDKETNTYYLTNCYFPEFTAECNIDIRNIISEKYNVNDLFKNADFSNLVQEESNYMFCNSIVHQAKLEVDKKGAEGAAVTIMQMCTTSAPFEEIPPKYVYDTLIVDKGFAYLLTDSDGVVLFSGVINNI